MAVSVCWILSCLLGFTPLFGWHNYSSLAFDSTNTSSTSFISPPCTFLSVISLPFMVYFNFLGCVIAPLLVMTLLYMRIFWSLQGRLKEGCPQNQASLLREQRLACSLALVLILFASCWIPLHLMNCMLLFHGPQAVTPGTLYTGSSSSPHTVCCWLFLYLHVEKCSPRGFKLFCFFHICICTLTHTDHNTYQQLVIYDGNKSIFQVFSCLTPTQQSTLWSMHIASQRSNRLTDKYGGASS